MLDRLLVRLTLPFLAFGLSCCGQSRPEPELELKPGVSLQLAEQRRAVLSEVNYRLWLSLPEDPEADIPGRIAVSVKLADTSTPLQLDFREDGNRIERVAVNGEPSRWRFASEHLVIPAAELQVGNNDIEIVFRAGSSSLNRNPEYLYTLFVPDRARTAFPVFDQPDLKATWILTLDIPEAWTAISAAPVANESVINGRRTLEFQPSDLISSYLFSFVAGKFESITRRVDGREMTLLHRETDVAKLARNVDEIFNLHAQSLAWLEQYTGIEYPFQKFDFALIPAYQYGGMEHVGAIQYRAATLMLDEGASDTQLLRRASLIAHETAHMWFGNLVTMRWFDDVWTKEVFANFMAAKVVNPAFPNIDHDLTFLLSHYPSAYGVDRSAGANAIRQPLGNLSDAGQLYGAIIYDKAPIMMRQLETLLGESAFREGLREYLATYAHANADWPALIAILDKKAEQNLAAWSKVWVNSPGRPEFELAKNGENQMLEQIDPAGEARVWPQKFSLLALSGAGVQALPLLADSVLTPLPAAVTVADTLRVFNADAQGYGLFPADVVTLSAWERLDDVARASLLINLYENLLEGRGPAPGDYLDRLIPLIAKEQNQLLLQLMLGHLQEIFWTLIPVAERDSRAAALEAQLWQSFSTRHESSQRKLLFDSYANVALSVDAVERVYAIWRGAEAPDNLPLSERDRIALVQVLAIKLPERSEHILAAQLEATLNPDERRRLAFIAPSLSARVDVRNAFFRSLSLEENRRTESWVVDALRNLHHPLRVSQSEAYILPSLVLLRDIQVTGDIFFPTRWLQATLENHNSARAVAEVEKFLESQPDYYPQLRMKILQEVDPVMRARALLEKPED